MSNITSLINGWEFDNPPTVTSFEFEKIDILYWNDFVNSNWHYAFHIGALYIIIIFGLQRWMRDRNPFDLKYTLFFWNSSLAVFSMIGFARVSPPLLHVLQGENGFYISVCLKKGLNVPNVLWGLLFMASKVLELGDTIFLVLRKRPLLFIQWYHHLVTLIVTSVVAPFMEPIGRWYGGLNYFVHSFMYPYFALKTVGVQVPTYFSRLVTILQFLQMVLGLVVNLASFYLQRVGYSCARNWYSIIAFSMLYGSFVVLFGKLLYDSLSNTNRKSGNQIKEE